MSSTKQPPQGSRVLAVVGSREFCDPDLVKAWVTENHGHFDWFVSGGAGGPDQWGQEAWVAARGNESHTIYLPDWNRYRKGAGFVRNQKILQAATFVACFWDGDSMGTLDDIGLAFGHVVPANVYVRFRPIQE